MKRKHNPNRVLITGGAGFIGSHLCERFLRDGWDVTCVDNFFTGSKENIRHLLTEPHFELVSHAASFFTAHWLLLTLALGALAVPVQRFCERRFAEQEVL